MESCPGCDQTISHVIPRYKVEALSDALEGRTLNFICPNVDCGTILGVAIDTRHLTRESIEVGAEKLTRH